MSEADHGDTISWGELVDEVGARLAIAYAEDDRAGAHRHGRLIVMRACGADTDDWVSRSVEPATERGIAAIDSMTARRLAGEPLQYVLGEWSFRHLDLFVDRRVLIPRPETEVVAGLALVEVDRLAPDGGPADYSGPPANCNAALPSLTASSLVLRDGAIILSGSTSPTRHRLRRPSG